MQVVCTCISQWAAYTGHFKCFRVVGLAAAFVRKLYNNAITYGDCFALSIVLLYAPAIFAGTYELNNNLLFMTWMAFVCSETCNYTYMYIQWYQLVGN